MVGFTNKVVLTGTEQWGQSGADILGMLDDWVDMVYTNGFANVDRIICGRQALKLLKNDKGSHQPAIHLVGDWQGPGESLQDSSLRLVADIGVKQAKSR